MAADGDVRAAALRLLARREYGRAELRRKLRRDHAESDVEQVLDRLVAEGLLSDGRFAEMFVRSRIGQGYGPLRVRAELRERGIGAEAAETALAEADVDWRALAAEVRRKRFGTELPQEMKEQARQARFLQYRGFDAADVRAVLKDDDW